MPEYTIKIKLLKPCIIGSGEGAGTIIDTDIVHDEYGIPWIPGRRVKGCLRYAGAQVKSMFDTATDKTMKAKQLINVPKTFGRPGQQSSAPVQFSNLYIEGYQDLRQWMAYLFAEYSEIISREQVLETFTIRRSNTAMEDGVQKDGSLRTVRTVNKGLVFKGTVTIDQISDNEDSLVFQTLYLSTLNFRKMGVKRNRLSKIKCSLFQGNTGFDHLLQEIKEQCIN